MLISRVRVNINGMRRPICEVFYQYEFDISIGECLHSPCTFSYPASFVLPVRVQIERLSSDLPK